MLRHLSESEAVEYPLPTRLIMKGGTSLPMSVLSDRSAECSLQVLNPDLRIAPLDQGQFEYFEHLVLNNVSVQYPETEHSYPRSLATAHFLGNDAFGLFTQRRTIWTVLIRSFPIGFFVASEKYGGSVKLGPIVIDKAMRAMGLGSKILASLQDYYSLAGYRKLYMTVPDHNKPALRLAEKAKFVREARLRRHYSVFDDEVVLAKLLPCQGIRPPEDSTASISPGYEDLSRFLALSCGQAYEGMGPAFTNRLIRAAQRSEGDYSLKGRVIYSTRNRSELSAIAVASAKRGGAVKLGPIAGDPADLSRLIREIEAEYFGNRRKRKIYAFVPYDSKGLLDVTVEQGYRFEGLLSSPYRLGAHMLIVSKQSI
jgi:RimJ/RimL family protein N-acetyltransferase